MIRVTKAEVKEALGERGKRKHSYPKRERKGNK